MKIEQFIESRLTLLLAVIGAIWGAYMIYIKLHLLNNGLATDDLFIYYNGLINTNFYDKWLYSAGYETAYNFPSHLLNHWQPALFLLWPIVKVGGPQSLLIIQALAPLWAMVFLHAITKHIELRPFDRFFVAILCLFHPHMMAGTMDSLYGFHGTSLLLYFGAPLAWAAITHHWRLALVLLVLFVNVRENGTFYIVGAVVGYLIIGNAFFRSWRQIPLTVGISGAVFIFATVFLPKIFGVAHIHAGLATSVLSRLDAILHNVSKMDSDWHNLFLWLWPGFASPGTLMTMLPDALILIIVGKKASHWYGMALVFAGVIAVAYGLIRMRAFAEDKNKGHFLTGFLALHLIAVAVAGPKEVNGQSRKLITRMGIEIPMASKVAARAAIDETCRTAVELQTIYGFGDIPYLQAPSQTHVAKYLVTIPSIPSGLTVWVNKHESELKVVYEDDYLKVFENPDKACR